MNRIFFSFYYKLLRIFNDNENLVKYAASGAVNVFIPWLAIYLLVDRLTTFDLLIVTSVYATVQLGAFADFGLSKFFQLKARAANINSFFYWVLPRVSLISIFVSLFLCLSFLQLVKFEDINIIWFLSIAGIIFSAAVRNLVCLRLELMGSYLHSTLIKLLFWILFFLPIFLFLDHDMHEIFLISSISRTIAITIIVYIITSLNGKAELPHHQLSNKSKIDLTSMLIFGLAVFLGNSLDRYWPGLISDPSTRISFILMMDIGIKTTFFAGAFGQAKLNEMFQKDIDEGISKKLIGFIALVSGILFIIISLVALNKTLSTQPDNILVFFLFLYICIFAANQVLVPIRQRLVSVRIIANRSLIAVMLAIIPLTISIYFESILFVFFGLIIKAAYELIVYSRSANV